MKQSGPWRVPPPRRASLLAAFLVLLAGCALALLAGYGAAQHEPSLAPPPPTARGAEAAGINRVVGNDGQSLSLRLEFGEPMNRASVEAAVSVSGGRGPGPTVEVEWADDTRAFVTLMDREPHGRYTLTVGPGAENARGEPLAAPVTVEIEPLEVDGATLFQRAAEHERVARALAAVGRAGVEWDLGRAVIAATETAELLSLQVPALNQPMEFMALWRGDELLTVTLHRYFAEGFPVCHEPPGNPEARHTLFVGYPALAAHVENHGDALGPCAGDRVEYAWVDPVGEVGTRGYEAGDELDMASCGRPLGYDTLEELFEFVPPTAGNAQGAGRPVGSPADCSWIRTCCSAFELC